MIKTFSLSTLTPNRLNQLRYEIAREKKQDILKWNTGDLEPIPYRLDFFINGMVNNSNQVKTFGKSFDEYIRSLPCEFVIEYRSNPSVISVVSFHLDFILHTLNHFIKENPVRG